MFRLTIRAIPSGRTDVLTNPDYRKTLSTYKIISRAVLTRIVLDKTTYEHDCPCSG